MDHATHSSIVGFIWNVADDVLRDLYVRGKYRDVILPMTVLRRLDAVLEPTKKPVLDMKASLDEAGITNQDAALRQAAGQDFYNTSKFTLRDLRACASQQQLKADFEAYLDGFSPNLQEILDNFEFRNQIPRLSKADALGTLIEKFLDPTVNLSPNPVLGGGGAVNLPGIDNHSMGTVFEELVRRFNEDNNEEAGEHWTPRDAVKLMARLIFLPIADHIRSGTYLLYDGACGTGGMLTVAEETLLQLAKEHGKQVATHLYGQEINAETYAICKADLLLKGEGEAADNIVGGPEHSTLAKDAFPSREFDFMLSNPPYGKSWKTDLERMGGKDGTKDPRFIIEHGGNAEYCPGRRRPHGPWCSRPRASGRSPARPLSLGPGRVLVGPVDGRVDHQLLQVGVAAEGLYDPGPDARAAVWVTRGMPSMTSRRPLQGWPAGRSVGGGGSMSARWSSPRACRSWVKVVRGSGVRFIDPR